MNKNYKTLKLILLTCITALIAPNAYAQGSSVESRLYAMEVQISALKAELAEQKKKSKTPSITMDKPAHKMMTTQSTKASGFNVNDTTFTIGGYIDFDAHTTRLSDEAIASGSIARDSYIPSVTPTGEGATTITDFTAQASRFLVHAHRNINGKVASAHLEMDFLGSLQGNERVTNSYSPRLRRAYFDYDGWRIGQEWSTFQNTSAIPESASFLALSDGMVFIRQPIIRYTHGNMQIAIETGNTTVTPATGNGRIEADSNSIPDVVLRYNIVRDYGNISVAALGRQLRLETGDANDDTIYGFGINIAGRLNMPKSRDDIRFQVSVGEGMGRYIGLNALNGAALDPTTGDLEAISSYGGYLAYRRPFGRTAR